MDEARCIGFMGKEGMVYATPRMVSDVEYACRDFLLAHLDPGEDSVGAHVSIDHLAATPLGLTVRIEARIAELDRRKVTTRCTTRWSRSGAASMCASSSRPRRRASAWRRSGLGLGFS